MTDGSSRVPPTLVALRAWWLALAALVAIIAGAPWLLAALPPWLVGAAAVFGTAGGTVTAAALAEIFETSSARVAGVVGTALLILACWTLGLPTGLVLAVWAGALLIRLASRHRTATAQQLLVNGTTALVTVAACLFAVEAVLRRPAIAYRLGLPSERRRAAARYDGAARSNVLGLRSPYERFARRPGVRRVVAIGDSFTWGAFVPATDSVWPAQLERQLQAEFGAETVEVINLGEIAYTTVNEVEAMNRLGWQFDPDLVVMQWLVNDVYHSGPNFERVFDFRSELTLLPLSVRAAAFGQSNLYGLFKSAMRNRTSYQEPEFIAQYSDTNPDWIANKAAFRALADTARVRGVPAVVMIWPMVGRRDSRSPETHPHRVIHELVTRTAHEAGLHVLDLTPVIAAEGREGLRWWATPYDSHPNAAAHELAARALAGEIMRAHLLRRTGTTGPRGAAR